MNDKAYLSSGEALDYINKQLSLMFPGKRLSVSESTLRKARLSDPDKRYHPFGVAFPLPIRIGHRSVRYRQRDIDGWLGEVQEQKRLKQAFQERKAGLRRFMKRAVERQPFALMYTFRTTRHPTPEQLEKARTLAGRFNKASLVDLERQREPDQMRLMREWISTKNIA